MGARFCASIRLWAAFGDVASASDHQKENQEHRTRNRVGRPRTTDFEDMKMKLRIMLALCAAITASNAMAQTPAKSGPNNNAVNSPGQNNSNAPVAGRNSFTEGQAKSRIEGAGYTNVSELKKDDNGVWRGKAAKGGATSTVSVDFEGNVNPAK